jgi:predicted AAA+ superfamily ATPase
MYAREIITSGFPGLRHLQGRALRAQLDGYLGHIVDRDFLEQGHPVRKPDVLRRWMTAYSPKINTPRDGTLLGQLFESLVTLSVRVYAQGAEARVRHLRTKDGRQEIDLIVERADQRVVAIEVKLSATVTDDDVRHLVWLRQQIGDEMLDAMIVTTGTHAYRRPDGIAVVPAVLLGL